MKTYLLSLLAVGLISAFIRALSEHMPRMKRHLSLLLSLVMLTVMLSPLVQLVQKLPFDFSLPEYSAPLPSEGKTEETLTALAASQLEEEMKKSVKRELGVLVKEIKADLVYDKSEGVFLIVSVKVKCERAVFDAVKAYIEEVYRTDVTRIDE